MKNRIIKVIISLCFILLAIGAVRGDYFSVIDVLQKSVGYDNSRSVEKMQEDFDAFLNQIFIDSVSQDTLTMNYTLKNKKIYGLDNMEVSFGNMDFDEQKGTYSVYENMMETLRSFDYDKLKEEQKICYDLAEYMMKLNLESSKYPDFEEYLSETSGVQAQLPVLLVEYNFYTENDIKDYIKLLNLIPEYFNNVIKYEKYKASKGTFMSDTCVNLVIKQCNAFVKNPDKNYLITTFEKRISGFANINDTDKQNYIAKNRDAVLNKVIPAYKNLVFGLESLKGNGKNNGGLCGFKNGKKYYEYLVRRKTGSDRSIKEMEILIDKELKQAQKKISEIIAKDSKIYDSAVNVKYK